MVNEKYKLKRSARDYASDLVCKGSLFPKRKSQILTIVDKNFHRAEVIMETMNPFVVKNIKEKSIEASKAKFTWGLKCGKMIEKMVPAFEWIRDISLVEGMKVMYPVYHLFGWIPVIKNMSNKLVILKKKW